MKTLLVIRHAKTKQPDFGEADYDRELTSRGETDAPEMARRMKERGLHIDTFVSSPAKRARQTCKLFVKAFNEKKEDIIFEESLYNAPYTAYYKVLSRLDKEQKNVAVFGHNPGIAAFADTLCSEVHIQNRPTCSIFAIEADCKKWSDFKDCKKKFLFFDYPSQGR